MTIDKHTLALISIVGSSLDVLGALYLAYDLLGGEHGPLRTLTRGVTYGVLFGAGYGLALGPVFGLASGVAHGITLAWEYSRASRHGPKPGFWYDTAMSAIRGGGFALGAAYLYGGTFGATFGALSTVGQVDCVPGRHSADPRLSTRHPPAFDQTSISGGGESHGRLRCHRIRQQPWWRSNARTRDRVGLKAGLVIGVVTAIASACTPFVEWIADHVPEKRMGVFGVGLILVGFALQSVQYWVALLDVSIRY